MLSYPVYFPPVMFRGLEKKKRAKVAEQNRIISEVSKYVNEVGIEQPQPFHRYLYFDIARVLNLSAEDVRRLCAVDAGGNGFIVLRPGLTSDQAFDEAAAS